MQDLTDPAMIARLVRRMIVEQEGDTDHRIYDQEKNGNLSGEHAGFILCDLHACQAREMAAIAPSIH
jgi:hypothetical protein